MKSCTAIVRQAALEGQRRVVDMMMPRVQQVIRQTKARILRGETRGPGKIVSVFEPSTKVTRTGKASKPTEFGKLGSCRRRRTKSSLDYDVYAAPT